MSTTSRESDKKTGDHLDAVFKIVVDEARRNPNFADRLRGALADGNDHAKPAKRSSTPTPSAATTLHAVNVLRQHGEQMLRGRLSNLRTKTELLQVAKRSGLRLTGKAAQKSATRPILIDGIVEAAQHYDSQREAVEG